MNPEIIDCTKLEHPFDRTKLECDAHNQLASAKAEMLITYNKKMEALSDDKAKIALSDAQNAWEIFSRKSCAYEESAWQEGGYTIAMYDFCMTKKAKQRTEELKAYLNCSENGCPQ